tara:strand:+ start:1077 stop:1625 length:549 start_codon:yes stop_codon:yes gene_type:complete
MVMKIQKILSLGAGIGAVSWLLGRAYNFFIPEGGIATGAFSAVELPLLPLDINVQQQIIGGVNTDVASRLLSTLGGGEIAVFAGLVMAVLAGIVVTAIGVYSVNAIKGVKIPLPTGRKSIGKITAIMVYGTLIGGFVLGLMGGGVAIPALGLVISLVIYYLIVGWVYGFLQRNLIKQLPSPE